MFNNKLAQTNQQIQGSIVIKNINILNHLLNIIFAISFRRVLSGIVYTNGFVFIIFCNKFIEKIMLDKYESFFKISKSPQCSIYSAFNRSTAQAVLMKRIKTKLSWNSMLAHKDIQLMNKCKVFPKMTQILKHKGQYYIVFQKPSGNSLSFANSVEKISLESFYQIFNDLLYGVKQIQAAHPNTTILPQWIYFHRNSLIIVHFQNFLAVEITQKKHVITYGMGTQNLQFQENTETETDFTPQQYKKNLIFNLGLIAYRFLTGKKQEVITSKDQYEKTVQNIRQVCERQIMKIANDAKLANFITKMISNNHFEVPLFNSVFNFFQSRLTQKHKIKSYKQRTVDIQIQKIHIGEKTSKEIKLKSRKCCLNEQKLNEKINKQKVNDLKIKIGLKSDVELYKSHRNKLFLPYISINRNTSFLNRHNPFLSTPHRQRENKQHLKTYDYGRQQYD